VAQGRKTGGRQKGSRNKTTRTAREIFDAAGLDPLEAQLGLAQQLMEQLAKGVPVKDRLDYTRVLAGVLKELTKYRHPQLKQLELTTDPDKPLVIRHRYGRRSRTAD
jgi:hypothetical protein